MTLGDPQVRGVPSQTREGQEAPPVQRRGAIMQINLISNLV